MWQMLLGIAWTNIGLLASCWLPEHAPRKLGRTLFWFGAPIQIFAIAHKSNFAVTPWLPVIIVCGALFIGLCLSWIVLGGVKIVFEIYENWRRQWLFDNVQSLVYTQKYDSTVTSSKTDQHVEKNSYAWINQHSFQGSFILAAILGNTMFVGMAIVPPLVDSQYLGWIVIFGIIHYVVGSYGIGVFLANHYGKAKQSRIYLIHVASLLKIPALWAFIIGYSSQSIHFSKEIEWLLQGALWLGVPTVFLLLGLQLGNLRKTQQLQIAILPALVKMFLLPGLTGLILVVLGMAGDARLAIVLMMGMPTNSANLILAEEYQLDPQLSASSIVFSTILLPLTIPLWYTLFH